MGNDSSNEDDQKPTVEYIFSHGPDFDPESRAKIKQENFILPFENKKEWEKIVASLQAKPDANSDAIIDLKNLFEALTDHNGYKFCKYLQSSIMLKEKKAFITQFLEETVPFIKELILKMPELLQNHGLKYMIPKQDKMVSLKRIQIASILAGCFFDLIATHCEFGDELAGCGVSGKFDSYINYFEYVRKKGIESDWAQEQVIIYRRVLKPENCSFLEHNDLCKNKTPLCDFKVYEKEKKGTKSRYEVIMQEMKQKEDEIAAEADNNNDDDVEVKQDEADDNNDEKKEVIIRNERIEDCFDGIHIDFANKYIGGGVLSGGNVQEEIRFTVNTECIISKLLCPAPMENDEAIIIFGSQQFCDYNGYGARFVCSGLVDREKERHKSVIVGIDAVHFLYNRHQYKLKYMMRELCKAYIGFSIDTQSMISHKLPIVSTGNWGCGMFGGDPQFKAMIQWIAATLAERDIAYYTFNDQRVEKRLKIISQQMLKKSITIGQLWKLLNKKRSDKKFDAVFDMIQENIN